MALCRRRLGMCSKTGLGEVAAPRVWVSQAESNLMGTKAVELRLVPSSSQERLGENKTRVPRQFGPQAAQTLLAQCGEDVACGTTSTQETQWLRSFEDTDLGAMCLCPHGIQGNTPADTSHSKVTCTKQMSPALSKQGHLTEHLSTLSAR